MICAALACALSCGAPTHHVVIAQPPDDVEILWKTAVAPHVDVATLDAPGLEVCSNALAKLRARAGALGCDALVIDGAAGYAATCIAYGEHARDRSLAAPPFGDSP
jgi:hypothetical protein